MNVKRVAYLGNIWEYPRALSRIEGVRLAGLIYEAGEARRSEDASAAAGSSATNVEAALQTAKAAGAKVLRVSSDEDVRVALEEIGPIDLGIMANFGIILSERTLRTPKEGIINFHPGLLPGQAGRAPVARLWKAGGGPSGLTIHTATAQPDAGPILLMQPFTVDPNKNLDSNILALYRLGLSALPSLLFPQISHKKPAI